MTGLGDRVENAKGLANLTTLADALTALELEKSTASSVTGLTL